MLKFQRDMQDNFTGDIVLILAHGYSVTSDEVTYSVRSADIIEWQTRGSTVSEEICAR